MVESYDVINYAILAVCTPIIIGAAYGLEKFGMMN